MFTMTPINGRKVCFEVRTKTHFGSFIFRRNDPVDLDDFKSSPLNHEMHISLTQRMFKINKDCDRSQLSYFLLYDQSALRLLNCFQ